MTALLRAELLRIRSRRLSWIALGLVVLIVLAVQIAVFTSVRPLTGSEVAAAETSYQQAVQDYEQNKTQYEADAKECVDQGNPPEACAYPPPKLEDYAQRSVSTFTEATELSITVATVVTALALLFLSASLIGADFSTGALANWLSFVPERGKVFASKLVAVAVIGAVVMAVVAALALGLTVLMTTVAGAEVVGLGRAAGLAGRSILVGVVAVLLGFGIAMLTRHTIAAIGTVLGYLFLTYVYNAIAFNVPSLQAVQRILPENHALSLLNRGHTYITYENTVTPDGTFDQVAHEHTITMAQSGIYWVVVLGLLIGLALLVFRRRDVN